MKTGKAPEYLQPLDELQLNMKNRLEVGTVLLEMRRTNIKNKFDAECLATDQNLEVRAGRGAKNSCHQLVHI